jgi:membrane-anchored protein YejM (alkaline phosphatase superfamily)
MTGPAQHKLEARSPAGRARAPAYAMVSRIAASSLVVALSCVLASCSAPVEKWTPDGTRNVLLVTIDTLRADHLGCYGYRRDTTPNLDALAREGVRFERPISVSSWTLPSHASLLTGLYPAEHGAVTDVKALPPSAPTLATVLADDGYDTFGAVSHVYLTHRYGFDKGFAHWDESAARGAPQHPVAARVVDRAIGWLRGRKDDAPFFMWLHIFDPHWEYTPPAPYASRFDPDYHGRMTGTYKSLKPYIKAVIGYDEPPPLDPRDLAHVVALYDGEIAYVDHELGRLFDALRRTKLLDQTLVVVTSDHGEEFMEHGSLEGHQWTLYEEVTYVPLIMRFPRASLNGHTVERLVSTIGVAGTVLDYLGLNQGWPSLYRLVDGSFPGTSLPQEALLDLTVRRKTRQIALRTPGLKLVRFADGRRALYADPAHSGEREDISASRPGDVQRLDERIGEMLMGMHRLTDAGTNRQTLDQALIERLRATGYMN